ncbi:hypothetical protein HDV04_003182 [Boothiomyces sp. JEL0838]|nr:hypothetical protein HDV04_003182 [Boothiomyces sp. JEL0838]
MKITLDDIDKTAEEILYGALLSHKLSNEDVDIEDVIEKTSVKLRQLAEADLGGYHHIPTGNGE